MCCEHRIGHRASDYRLPVDQGQCDRRASINLAVSFVAFLVGQALGVSEKGASAALQTVFVVVATAALTFGLFVLGYLSGVVLRTKLPAFPMRTWLAFYVVSARSSDRSRRLPG